MASYIAPGFLAVMCVWGIVDSKITANFASHYKPAVKQENPTFTPDDVTAIICTLDPPPEFPAVLCAIYRNLPMEIIIVTTRENAEAVLTVARTVCLMYNLDFHKVSVLVSVRGARAQLMTGVQQATGSIIATCNDRVIWSNNYLVNMLACFEDPKVGAAGPSVEVSFPEKRISRGLITPWEVAGTRLAYRSPASWTSMHVAARWCWILAGCSCLFRTSILQDSEFVEAFTNDYWRGVKLDVGDDTFISRWLLKNDWVIAIQYSKETRVWRSVKRTPALINQMLRWERSTIQSFIRTTYEVPQMWKNGYVARKTIERLFKAPLAILHTAAWAVSFYSFPIPTACLLGYYILKLIPSYEKFFATFPSMKKYWWAAVAADFSYVVIGPWAWLTLSDNSWERGEGKYEGVEENGKILAYHVEDEA